jgi:hypothetical protein
MIIQNESVLNEFALRIPKTPQQHDMNVSDGLHSHDEVLACSDGALHKNHAQ